MDEAEARDVMEQVLAWFRELKYSELVRLAHTQNGAQIVGRSGVEYNVEIEIVPDIAESRLVVLGVVLWGSTTVPEGTSIRVMGSVDDGRFLTSLRPISGGFIMAPDGRCT